MRAYCVTLDESDWMKAARLFAQGLTRITSATSTEVSNAPKSPASIAMAMISLGAVGGN
jgi:hypothetical protein